MTLIQAKALNRLVAREKPGWRVCSGLSITMTAEQGPRLVQIQQIKGTQQATLKVDMTALRILENSSS